MSTNDVKNAASGAEPTPEAEQIPEADAAATEGAIGVEEPAAEPVAGSAGESDEVNELRERLLRLAAEYDNYRKRTERERGEARNRAQSQIVERLLEPLDDLHRVIAVDAAGTTAEAVIEGVRMVERKLYRVLESAGLAAIDAHGKPFDPTVHEALMTAGTEHEHEDDHVGQVFQIGYRFNGTLLRPARVQVKKYEG